MLAQRAPAAMAHQISVGGPDYLLVGVETTVGTLDSANTALEEQVRTALSRFLHPLTGGPRGEGWPFGRGVHLSDIARVLERIEGLDHVETMELLLDGAPHGESVHVPFDRIVAAGALRVRVVARSRV
jgi:hypothetical protein